MGCNWPICATTNQSDAAQTTDVRLAKRDEFDLNSRIGPVPENWMKGRELRREHFLPFVVGLEGKMMMRHNR